ncbi:MAG: tetratricopeptide repeat protein [Actinobacteria bacterium]|nr:tetratricopeptide repeat protein [Actinomycetota bacterium]
MNGPRMVLLGLVITVAAGAAAGVSVLGADRAETTASVAPPQASSPEPGDLSALQAQVRDRPDDWEAWAALGAGYVEQARVSADPSWYPKAEGALERSLGIRPDANLSAILGKASLAAARHDFASSLEWGTKALALAPERAAVHGVLGDALVELGRYEEGFAAYQAMVDAKPNFASYARISYARELQGDAEGAIEAMHVARGASGSAAEAAFAEHQLGELHWNEGRADRAAVHYRRAAALDPDFVPPRAALARWLAAAGDVEAAVREYRAVIDRVPAPQYLAELADLAAVTGREELRQEQIDLIGAQFQLLAANGVAADLELALFSADHGSDVGRGLAAAEAEWARRKSTNAADALAWQLLAHGRAAEALTYADQALRLGTRNALFYYHRGRINLALGREVAATEDLRTALAINPHFSLLHAAEARRVIGSAGGER